MLPVAVLGLPGQNVSLSVEMMITRLAYLRLKSRQVYSRR